MSQNLLGKLSQSVLLMAPKAGLSPPDRCEHVNPACAVGPEHRFVASLRGVTRRPCPREAAMPDQYLAQVRPGIASRRPRIAGAGQRRVESVKALHGVIKPVMPSRQGVGSLPYIHEEQPVLHAHIMDRQMLHGDAATGRCRCGAVDVQLDLRMRGQRMSRRLPW